MTSSFSSRCNFAAPARRDLLIQPDFSCRLDGRVSSTGLSSATLKYYAPPCAGRFGDQVRRVQALSAASDLTAPTMPGSVHRSASSMLIRELVHDGLNRRSGHCRPIYYLWVRRSMPRFAWPPERFVRGALPILFHSLSQSQHVINFLMPSPSLTQDFACSNVIT